MDRECEAAVVTRLREGDISAFDRIYDTFNGRLLSFLIRMARNRSVAEDLLEETWLRLISSARDLHADTRLGPWLFTVARNLYVSHCRVRARERSGATDLFLLWPGALSQSPFEATCLNELEERLEAAIASLPPIYREVILLVGVEQLRPADAAKVCGVSPEALRQRLSRARGLISTFLADTDATGKEVSKEVSHDARR